LLRVGQPRATGKRTNPKTAVEPRVGCVAGGVLALLLLLYPPCAAAQSASEKEDPASQHIQGDSTQDYNRRIEQLRRLYSDQALATEAGEYRIGAHDLLEINVFEAPELNRSLRVSAGGEISMPLLGSIQSAGLTAQDLEGVLEGRLRIYMKDPHVSVFVNTIESHPVSVVGAVKKPGVFQVRGPKTVLEMLSMAEGLDEDAGDEVMVMRGAGLRFVADATKGQNAAGAVPVSLPADPSQPRPGASESPDESTSAGTIHIKLADLLESGDPKFNVAVFPGDIVKVKRAGSVYVVGDVKKPGGFPVKNDREMSVLKAIALAEGLTTTSAKSRTRIIRTDEKTGERLEIPIDLGKIFAGKIPDPTLKPSDIVFVPNSAGKTVFYRGTEAAIATATGFIIFH
jgi:polysaccharide export outer membrane protein